LYNGVKIKEVSATIDKISKTDVAAVVVLCIVYCVLSSCKGERSNNNQHINNNKMMNKPHGDKVCKGRHHAGFISPMGKERCLHLTGKQQQQQQQQQQLARKTRRMSRSPAVLLLNLLSSSPLLVLVMMMMMVTMMCTHSSSSVSFCRAQETKAPSLEGETEDNSTTGTTSSSSTAVLAPVIAAGDEICPHPSVNVLTTLNLNEATSAPTESECDLHGGVILMAFLLRGTPEEATLNETEILLFESFMANLTARFAPADQVGLVRTDCIFQFQDSDDFLTTPQDLIALLPAGQDSDGDSDSDSDTNSITNITLTFAPAMAPTHAFTNDTSLLAFQYIFEMIYQSRQVNISNYTQEFLEYTGQNVEALSYELADLLKLQPRDRLVINDFRQVQQIMRTRAPNTLAPTFTIQPSATPTLSNAPSASRQPTNVPSVTPTRTLSSRPSDMPSQVPTLAVNSTAKQNYALDFVVEAPPGAGFLNSTQQEIFCTVMEQQTQYYLPRDDENNIVINATTNIQTMCFFVDQQAAATTPISTLETAATATQSPTTEPATTKIVVVQEDATLAQQGEEDLGGGPARRDRKRKRERQRQLQTKQFASTAYTYFLRMQYKSDTVNVTELQLTELFPIYLVFNASVLEDAMAELLNLEPSNNLTFKGITPYEVLQTPAPSSAPSVSPSTFPSVFTTLRPTKGPTEAPSMLVPSTAPRISPAPEPMNPPSDAASTSTIVLAVIFSTLGSTIVLGIAYWICVRPTKNGTNTNGNPTSNNNHNNSNNRMSSTEQTNNINGAHANEAAATAGQGAVWSKQHGFQQNYNASVYNSGGGGGGGGGVWTERPSDTVGGSTANPYQQNRPNRLLVSPSTGESILSNPSLLTNGNGIDDDDDDDIDDGQRDFLERSSKLSPLDDFDQFKDQNLELMRSNVTNLVLGLDGMMSQALTMALMEGDNGTDHDVLWGGATKGLDIEASALCEVTDWLKRNDFASYDEM